MKTKFKERLIKLSHNSRCIMIIGIIVMIFSLGCAVLALFSKTNFNILINVAIFLPLMYSALFVTFKTIRKYDCQGEIIFKNKLGTLLLADIECVQEYICVIAIVVPFALDMWIGYILGITAVISYFIIPKRISRHFKEKIIK